MVNNALYTSLNREYKRAKLTLVKRISKQDTGKDVAGLLQSALALATERQSHHCITYLRRSFRAGFVLESKSIKATIKTRKPKIKVTSAVATPESIAFDYSKISKTHRNKVTRDTIGAIGTFNKTISKQLLSEYDTLVANNVLVNSIAKHGFTENIGAILLKQGMSKEMIDVIKSQSTTNKMISILEQQGIRGGMPPNRVSKLLIPEIRAAFGAEGVVINNAGKVREVLRVNASGEFWWEKVKIKNTYKTTVKNYSSMVATTSMKRAHNEGRLATMRQSGLVDKYRFISAQTGNTCLTCLGMHGLIVHPTDVSPPIHVKCYCTLTPVYKDPDLNLHGNDYYMKQRDAGLWRKHQFNEYNKGLVPADRILNPNFLPLEMLKGMPKGKKMEAIRAALLE
jgi:SPP1 gp7 family putative phage head morphogenesis protein